MGLAPVDCVTTTEQELGTKVPQEPGSRKEAPSPGTRTASGLAKGLRLETQSRRLPLPFTVWKTVRLVEASGTMSWLPGPMSWGTELGDAAGAGEASSAVSAPGAAAPTVRARLKARAGLKARVNSFLGCQPMLRERGRGWESRIEITSSRVFPGRDWADPGLPPAAVARGHGCRRVEPLPGQGHLAATGLEALGVDDAGCRGHGEVAAAATARPDAAAAAVVAAAATAAGVRARTAGSARAERASRADAPAWIVAGRAARNLRAAAARTGVAERVATVSALSGEGTTASAAVVVGGPVVPCAATAATGDGQPVGERVAGATDIRGSAAAASRVVRGVDSPGAASVESAGTAHSDRRVGACPSDPDEQGGAGRDREGPLGATAVAALGVACRGIARASLGALHVDGERGDAGGHGEVCDPPVKLNVCVPGPGQFSVVTVMVFEFPLVPQVLPARTR